MFVLYSKCVVSPTEGADWVVTISHFNILDKHILLLVQMLSFSILIREKVHIIYHNFRLSTVCTIFMFRGLDCVVSHI
jgi:hypothetical protein